VLPPADIRKDPALISGVLAFLLSLGSRILVISIAVVGSAASAWSAGTPAVDAAAAKQYTNKSPAPTTSASREATFAFDIGLTEQYTDNSALTATKPQSDLVTTPHFGLSYARQSAKTNANVNFRISRDIYRRETQQNQTFPSLDAVVDWRIVPERFTWTLKDFASQNQIDVQDAPTTDNTQNVNAFITGPDGFFHFGPSNTLQLGARFADTRFEVTDENSTRVAGYARWLYSSSPRTVLSANYDGSSVRFQDPNNPDFDRHDLFFQVRTTRARSDFVFDLGETLIDQQGLSSEPEPLLRFSGNRRLTAKSSVGLAIAQIQADSGSNLFTVGLAPPGLAPGGNVANTPDIFTDRSLNVFYTNTGRRTKASVSMFARDQDYKTTPSDQSSWGTVFSLNRTLTPRLTVSLLASYTNTRYPQNVPTLTDQDTVVGFNFSYSLGRWLALNGGISWQNRNSTDPTQDYTETRAILGITYARTSL
jgi:Putative beta-barrel porin 2